MRYGIYRGSSSRNRLLVAMEGELGRCGIVVDVSCRLTYIGRRGLRTIRLYSTFSIYLLQLDQNYRMMYDTRDATSESESKSSMLNRSRG